LKSTGDGADATKATIMRTLLPELLLMVAGPSSVAVPRMLDWLAPASWAVARGLRRTSAKTTVPTLLVSTPRVAVRTPT
jgi:hypothetical protein